MSFGNLGLLLAFWIPAFAGMTGGWDGMGWDGMGALTVCFGIYTPPPLPLCKDPSHALFYIF